MPRKHSKWPINQDIINPPTYDEIELSVDSTDLRAVNFRLLKNIWKY